MIFLYKVHNVRFSTKYSEFISCDVIIRCFIALNAPKTKHNIYQWITKKSKNAIMLHVVISNCFYLFFLKIIIFSLSDIEMN